MAVRELLVHVGGKPVAVLESDDGFRHVCTYLSGTSPGGEISLLMPVRRESYVYEKGIHPVFQMHLPEGFLLSVIQEQFGPIIGASSLSLLSVIGRNTIGRVQYTLPDQSLEGVEVPFDLQSVLKGNNSEEAFAALVRRHALSAVSGVVPKFIAPGKWPEDLGTTSFRTSEYIIKGSSSHIPYVALNEHLCMEVARRAGMRTATTFLSDDGHALAVKRFDIEKDGTRLGFEDFCGLLLLTPPQKYETTWERLVARLKAVVPSPQREKALDDIADVLLLTYALRNADCHAKNVGLLYRSVDQIGLAPIYDMLTTTVYDEYRHNPPGLSIGGRKVWAPGKTLEVFINARLGIPSARLHQKVERIGAAILEVVPILLEKIDRYQEFREIGKRMLLQWNDGMNSLKLHKAWRLPDLAATIKTAGFSDPRKPKKAPAIGRSELIGRRGAI